MRRILRAAAYRLIPAEMPANLITLAHFSVSGGNETLAGNGRAGRGDLAPNHLEPAFDDGGSASAALTSVLSLSTILSGVAGGATMPYQPLAS